MAKREFCLYESRWVGVDFCKGLIREIIKMSNRRACLEGGKIEGSIKSTSINSKPKNVEMRENKTNFVPKYCKRYLPHLV